MRDLGCQQVRRETEVLAGLVEPEDGAPVALDRLDGASDDLCDAAGHIDGRGAQRGDVVVGLDDQGQTLEPSGRTPSPIIADVRTRRRRRSQLMQERAGVTVRCLLRPPGPRAR